MNRENLIRLRDELIPSLKKRNAKLDFDNYRRHDNTEHVCNTTACLAGYSSELLSVEEWNSMVVRGEGDIVAACVILCEEFYGVSTKGEELDASTWEFLFGPMWDGSYDYAIDRINYVLDNGSHPDYLDIYGEYLDFPWDYDEYLLNNSKIES